MPVFNKHHRSVFKKTRFGPKQSLLVRKLPLWPLVLVLMFAVLGTIAFVLTAEQFKIKSITISGLQQLKRPAVEKSIALILEQRAAPFVFNSNVFVFYLKRSNTAQTLLQKLPLAARVEISIQGLLEPRVKFIFTERTEQGLWCQPKTAETDIAQATSSPALELNNQEKYRCYFFDESGKLFKQAPATQGTLLPSIIDGRDISLELGTDLDNQVLEITSFIIKKLNRLGLRPSKIFLDPFLRDVRIELGRGWSVLVDPSQKLEPQFEALQVYLSENENNPPKEYMDLRVVGRVYVK